MGAETSENNGYLHYLDFGDDFLYIKLSKHIKVYYKYVVYCVNHTCSEKVFWEVALPFGSATL